MIKRNLNKSFYSKNSMLEVSYYRQKETNKPTILLSIYKCIGHTKSKDGKELPLFRAYNDVKEDRCATKMDYSEIAMIQKCIEVIAMFGFGAGIKLLKDLEPNQSYLPEGTDAKLSVFHSETIVEFSIAEKYSGVIISLTKFKETNKPKYSFFIKRNDMFGLSAFLRDILLLNTIDESENQPNWDEVRKKNIPETVTSPSVKDTVVESTNIIDDLFM